MKKSMYRILIATCAFLLLLQPSGGLLQARSASSVDRERNRLIGYMIARQLPILHYSDKVMNDSLALAAFGLYIKQLDSQKRFLLKEDVEQLRAFAPYIDDNLKRGTITLPDAGYAMLSQRIAQVEKMVDAILKKRFDPNTKVILETDPDKLQFAASLQELQQRWSKILRAQLINRFLDLQEENKAAPQKKSDDQLWNEAYEKIGKQYRDFFHRLHQETLQDHYDRFFNAVARAFGPHTNYISPADKEQFDISMRGSLEGIGAMLREDGGLIKVVRIIPGSAAARQGRLKAEDVILQVAEDGKEPVDITDMRLRDAVRLIRGPKGTTVRLTVRRPDGVKEVIPIVRNVVQIEATFVKDTVLDVKGAGKVGYLQIPSFYRDFEKDGAEGGRNASDDTRKAIRQLKSEGVKGIILDLRDNGGGALVDAVRITGMFIDQGPVVEVKNSNGAERILSDEEPGREWDGPLVVLVNKFSASASEIVAAALQDYGRAVIMGGPHTHGKGTVQTIIDLNENIPLLHLHKYKDLGAIKVTIQKFYRVTGGSTQYKGVVPDIVLPSLLAHLKSGERSLEYSLPWDSIPPVEYTPYPHHLNLPWLEKRSLERVAHDKGFQTLREEEALAVERSKVTKVTLDLDDMRAKRKEAEEARNKIGEYYLKYRDEQPSEDGELKDEQKTPEQIHKRWLKEIHDDPYIREATRVIRDILHS